MSIGTRAPRAEAPWERRQRETAALGTRFPSGERQYHPRSLGDEAAEAAEVQVAAEGGWDVVTPERYQELIDEYRESLIRLDAERSRSRTAGWKVPEGERSRWPIYPGEAVTFTTEWGSITVGRALARIYDLDGWPDAVILESMARQQAAREGVPA